MVARGAEALKVRTNRSHASWRDSPTSTWTCKTRSGETRPSPSSTVVDQLLDGAMYGPDTNVVPSSSSPPPPLSSSKRRSTASTNNNKNNSNDNNGGSQYDATGEEMFTGTTRLYRLHLDVVALDAAATAAAAAHGLVARVLGRVVVRLPLQRHAGGGGGAAGERGAPAVLPAGAVANPCTATRSRWST